MATERTKIEMNFCAKKLLLKEKKKLLKLKNHYECMRLKKTTGGGVC